MIDTIIIGAGPSGLCAAKTILQCDPHADLRILDSSSTIGGVWAKEKIYPTLKTNHYFGGLDFSDFPMLVGHGAQPFEHIPGIAVYEFLNAYARQWNLHDKVQLNTKVLEISRIQSGGGWRLHVAGPDDSFLECRKLIVSVGVNNRPSRPEIQGSADFKAPLLHSADLGYQAKEVFENDRVRTVAVLGGGKSAYDAVHLASSSGRQVEWIIRKSGKGPVWVFPLVTQMGPFEVQKDRLASRRFVSFFSPCIWADGFRWIRNLLHATVVGKYIVHMFWAQMQRDTIKDCGYRTDDRLKGLEPEQNPFWYGTCAGSCKYLPELQEGIKNGQIRIHREDIDHLSEGTIHLASGQRLSVDAFVTATGFSAKPAMNFTPADTHSDLGIPSTDLSVEQQKFWARLDLQSDQEISQQLPLLLKRPAADSSASKLHVSSGNDYTPFRLYRSIAPPGLTAQGDRSLVFLGVYNNFANIPRLEIQCLWAYAYLNNQLSIDPRTVYQETSLTSRFNRWRSPLGHGKHFPDHVFDQLPYFDTLLRDLGVSTRRKQNIFREIFEAYSATDYRGIVQEWLSRHNKI